MRLQVNVSGNTYCTEKVEIRCQDRFLNSATVDEILEYGFFYPAFVYSSNFESMLIHPSRPIWNEYLGHRKRLVDPDDAEVDEESLDPELPEYYDLLLNRNSYKICVSK